MSLYQVADYRLTAWHLGYLVLLAIVTVALMSLVPIVRVVQLGTSGALRGDARGVTQGMRAKHLGAGLVAGQMALAIVLLAGAGVLVRSIQAFVRADSGVHDPANILVGLVRLPSLSYSDARARRAYFDRLEARMQAIPGVVDAAVTSAPPMTGGQMRPIEIGGRPAPGPGEAEERVRFVAAGPGYFHVVGLDPVAGRVFTSADQESSQPVAVVNESFAALYWSGESAIGKSLRSLQTADGGPSDQRGLDVMGQRWRVVVGVVPDINHGDAMRQQFKPAVYLPFQQETPAVAASFMVRTLAPATQSAAVVREAVQAVAPDVSLQQYSTLAASFAFDRDRGMDSQHSELGKYSTIAPIFAGIALLLAAVGLAAVIAHAVGQRTKEIGVRMAIGAATRDVVRMIVQEGMRPVLLGLAAGLPAALAVNRVLRSQLVAVSPYDPLTLAAAVGVLIAVALFACRLPAGRAARVDPAVALRHD